MPGTVDHLGVPPSSQAQPDDHGSGGFGGDHPGAPGGGFSVPPQVGFDVITFPPNYCLPNSRKQPPPGSLGII